MKYSAPEFVTGLKCLICENSYPYGNIFTCPKCGIEGILDVQYDYTKISNLKSQISNHDFNIWRYRDLLPISPDIHPPILHVGWTPIYDAFYSCNDLIPSHTNTIADSIAVGTPRNWRRAIQQIKLPDGKMIAVSDDEILEAMRITARLGGVFGEPAGVTGVAGLKRATEKKIIKPTETVLVVITGNGLKDIQSAKQAVGKEYLIEPTLEAVRKIFA